MSAPLIVSPVVVAVTDAVKAAMVGALADVKVLDAGGGAQQYAKRSFTVGGTWDPDQADETITTTVTESGAARHLTEVTRIRCIAYTGSGNADLGPLRASTGAILSAARGAVRSITTIDGMGARGQVTDEAWTQGDDDQGSLVMAACVIEVRRLL